MQANRSRDTRPELSLRSALHARGLRYRVATRPIADLNRTADVVFRSARVAVFVDGCFWHGCPAHRTSPKANAQYWSDKIRRNQERDRDTDRLLRDAGWIVIRIWEHDEIDDAVELVVTTVRERRLG